MAEDIRDYEGDEDLVRLGRSLAPQDRQFFSPPEDLWTRIAAEVATPSATVTPLTPRRRARFGRPLLVAAISAAAAVVLVFAVSRAGDGVRVEQEVALSNEGLDPRGVSSSGSARLVVLSDGTRAIELDVRDLPASGDEFFELWLIDTNVEGMVSMGPVRGSGRFVIPRGVDPNRFPIVDLSIEPVDGDPTHSGASVLRGQLV